VRRTSKGVLARTPPDMAAVRAAEPATRATILRCTRRAVATMISGGHAPNALPQRTTANVNCRILPGALLRRRCARSWFRIFAEPKLKVRFVEQGKAVDVAPDRKAMTRRPATARGRLRGVEKSGRELLAGRAHRAGDGDGRVRQHLHHVRRHSQLRPSTAR